MGLLVNSIIYGRFLGSCRRQSLIQGVGEEGASCGEKGVLGFEGKKKMKVGGFVKKWGFQGLTWE